MTDDPYEMYRNEIRSEGFSVNPWRLGVAVGKAGEELPSPYTTLRGSKLYSEGLRAGLARYREAARAAKFNRP